MRLLPLFAWTAGLLAFAASAAPQGDPPVPEPKHTNHLIHETSPYLQQHAHNPVDWYPWGPEALAAAKKQDKPIFLSIGYSACHWCHVMEHESFENEAIAKVMNEGFICIKVDREERPDLDEIYMNAVQMLTGSGGWPMSVFLTPDLKPFYGGTYFPPEDRWGRPGFPSVLQRITEYYHDHRDEVDKTSQQIAEVLASVGDIRGESGKSDAALLDNACALLQGGFDEEWGGFGGAPKFPPSMELNLLLRRAQAAHNAGLAKIVETTLDRMARGGMYDQVGGGFCRYSTDERWLVPHFEKMLYDNALLARTYLAAYQYLGKPFYARIARETLDYVLRDMMRPGGGFYSSEDADSEQVEGKFYVWTLAEVTSLLGAEEGELFCSFYDITRKGNWEEQNIPNVPVPLEEFAKKRGQEPAALRGRLDASRAKVFAARAKRVRPGRDEKILTAWNGLMLQSMIAGYQVLGDRKYLDAALATTKFLLENAQKDGRLLVTWRDGHGKLNAYLDEYAFLCAALIDLYEATFDVRWLDEAVRLDRATLEHFWDAKEGGFFFTSNDHEALIARTKAPYDGVIPSGNSECVRNLVRLSVLTGDATLRERAGKVLELFHGSMKGSARGFANMLCALDLHLSPVKEIAIVGEGGEFLKAIHGMYLPNRVIAGMKAGEAGEVGKRIPLLAGKVQIGGVTTVYVCQGYACRKPVTSVEELVKLLRE